jgi:enoyl-CoA hydratase
VDGGVAIVTLNAPDRHNAHTPSMADELISTFDEVDAKPEVGALVVRAVGKSFCAGGDIATLTAAGKDPAASDTYEGMGKIYDSFYRLGQVRVPTVAAVRGSAVGAGMNMLLAADLRIVAKDVRLLAGFLKRGMHPGGGHFVILSRLIGREAAAAMALFGEEVNGDKAVELGLAWESMDDAAGGGPSTGAGCRGGRGSGAGAGGRGQLPQGGRERRCRLGRCHPVRAPSPDVVHASASRNRLGCVTKVGRLQRVHVSWPSTSPREASEGRSFAPFVPRVANGPLNRFRGPLGSAVAGREEAHSGCERCPSRALCRAIYKPHASGSNPVALAISGGIRGLEV